MCGIVGYIGFRDALEVIPAALEKLEYRGYDSAGVAIIEDNQLKTYRAVGKLAALKQHLADRKDRGQIRRLGIGHTRWATHGRPSENNAHPHSVGRVSLIHNGIIENYLELKSKLTALGLRFQSDTDSEVAALLFNHYLKEGYQGIKALFATCKDIRGSYAFVALDSEAPERIFVAKNSTPIIVGIGQGEFFVASDIPALLQFTREIIILEDGDFAEISKDKLEIFERDKSGQLIPTKRGTQIINWDPITAQKSGYKHFMLKEIFEQETVVRDSFRGRLSLNPPSITLSDSLHWTPAQIKSLKGVVIIGCGSAWHAGLIGKFYLEKFAQLPCYVDYASEYRYRPQLLDQNYLVLAISQSGETLDTLAAFDRALVNFSKESYKPAPLSAAICNVVGSSLARRCQNVIFNQAGPEISVASTKAFTTQLVCLYLLSLYIGSVRGIITEDQLQVKINDLLVLPKAIAQILDQAKQIEEVAKNYFKARDFLFLGRGNCYPIALEGALKLKEISYIHAEGYPAGEMKHGPLALIDENLPVVMLLNKSKDLFEKSLANMKEAQARGARVIAISDVEADYQQWDVNNLILAPFISEDLSPILFTVPLQLLAYYVAVLNGTDVDLPRNLAKSVTVE
ncbi:MAG TPA: glutamine--fructose-6-phosphate transaminase (isomerizing) [Oligoflexia bacterium]|nr:glutamine--fructose-6-phosphate transaminase (isomerizing) [Oligoflexia bacterium]HMP27162.1 glutamine--fructose-6-phosphate transaminase (isomerizing) [Oligoflexia bacterium]